MFVAGVRGTASRQARAAARQCCKLGSHPGLGSAGLGSDPELSLGVRSRIQSQTNSSDSPPELRGCPNEINPSCATSFRRAEHDLFLALDLDEGAVGAFIGEHEVVVAPLDGAVVARSVLVFDHDLAARVAANR